MVSRLIKDQHVWPSGKGHRQIQPPLLTHRHLTDPLVGLIRPQQAKFVERYDLLLCQHTPGDQSRQTGVEVRISSHLPG